MDLLEARVAVTKLKQGWAELRAREALHVAWLVGDDGETLGAMLTNHRATVELGARLIMMPAAGIDAQLRAGAPSRDLVDATSEVMNTLSSTLNEADGNPHVHTTALAPLGADAPGWISEPAAEAAFSCDEGGRLLMLSR